jgi:hypothetical protein
MASTSSRSQATEETITIRCKERDAADEDLIEHSGDLARKKQLLSQDHAAAKRAAFATAHPDKHPLGMPGRKQDFFS